MARVAVLLVLASCCLLASASTRNLNAVTKVSNCQVCVTATIRNVTTQGALTAAACSTFVNQYLNSVFLAKYSLTDVISFKCNAGQKPGLSVTACSAVPEQDAIMSTVESIVFGADTLYTALLKSTCPASKAGKFDYVQLYVESTGTGCAVVTNRTLGFRYCGEDAKATAMSFPQQDPSPVSAEASGPVVKAVPAGQGYCWICFYYWMPYNSFDYYAKYQTLAMDLISATGLQKWSYQFQPADRKIDYVLQSTFNYPPYGISICSSSTYYYTSPATGVLYDFTSDYLTQVLRNNDFFTQKYGLGCKSKANPAINPLTQNSLYYTVSALDMDKYGGIYPADSPAGVPHYCSPPGQQDGSINVLGYDC